MARRRREIDELKERIKALPAKDQAEVIKGVMTPAMRFSLLLEQTWKKQAGETPRAIAKAAGAARRAAEREHAKRRASRERKRAS
jgi:hypothetical protein